MEITNIKCNVTIKAIDISIINAVIENNEIVMPNKLVITVVLGGLIYSELYEHVIDIGDYNELYKLKEDEDRLNNIINNEIQKIIYEYIKVCNKPSLDTNITFDDIPQFSRAQYVLHNSNFLQSVSSKSSIYKI